MSEGNNTSIEVKRNNRNRVYQYLYYRGGRTLKDIADNLNMSMPTAIQIVKKLKDEQLIQEGDLLKSTGGRRAKLLCCNSSAGYSVGIDITKHHIAFLAIDIESRIKCSRRIRIPFQNTDTYFRMFSEHLNSFLEESGVRAEKILGVGISIPGILSEDGRYMRYGGVIDFVDGDLRRFSEGVPYPCLFSNDANAGGYAELWRQEQMDKAVYLSLSNSVGGAILIGNAVYFGDNQKSGEFGHMTLVDGGRLCYCGRRGCLDAYCSASILEKSGGSLPGFFEKLEAGKEEQRTVWEEYKRYLVLAINNIRVCFDCQIILGGYVGSYLEPYMDEIKEGLEQYRLFEQNVDYVKVCYYKQEAAAMGVALLHIKEFIKNV